MRLSIASLLTLLSASAWAEVTGRVVGPEGSPLAGVSVSAYARETARAGAARRAEGRPPAPLATVESGADGTFRFDQPNVVRVDARAEGFALSGADALDGSVTLSLRGRVESRGFLRANGRPVAGAAVTWVSPRGFEIVTRSAADGSFSVPRESGLLWVFAPDLAPHQARFDGKDPDQELSAGTALTGSVVDAAGRPVGGAKLWVNDELSAGTTDARGAFRIAHAPEYWQSLVARTERLVGVTARRTGPLVIRLAPAHALEGTVRDAKTSQPVAGATVTVWNEGYLGGSTDTDARGRYSLPDLPAGSYQARAQRVGFRAAGTKSYEGRKVDLRTVGTARLDLALARIPRVAGRVVDEEQRPVAGARVSLSYPETPFLYTDASLDFFDMDGEQGEDIHTAADGSFSLAVDETNEGLERFLGSARSSGRPVVVMKRGYAGARAEVPEPPDARPLALTLVRGVELSGHVTSQDGAPLAGVAVDLAEDGSLGGVMIPMEMVLESTTADVGWATSDEAGRFAVRVHAKSHVLELRKPGHAPRRVQVADPRSGAVEVVLAPAATIGGRVVRADGSGVAGVRMSASQEMSSAHGSADTAADGAFVIGDLAPGVYELKAVRSDLGIARSRTLEAPVADVVFMLAPGGTLRGRVVDETARTPVPSFKLDVSPASDGAREGFRHVEVDDASGAFTLPDLPLGEVTLQVRAEGYAAKTVEDVTVSGDGDAPDLEIALAADTPIRGRVTAETGEPLPDVSVSPSSSAPGVGRQETDQEGNFEIRGLAAGPVTLAFHASGYLSEERKVDSRQARRVDVVMKQGLTLRVEVSHNGTPEPDAGVNAFAPGTQASSGVTDERGRATLTGLQPGKYTVSAQSHKARAQAEDVDVETAGTVRLALQEPRTAILRGRVVGLPPAAEGVAAMVSASGAEGGESMTFVDSTQAFRMDDAPAGEVRVQAQVMLLSGSQRRSRPVELTLPPGSETETVLEFPDDVVIGGVVTRDEQPVPFASVVFSSPDERGGSVRADARGAYEVVGLEVGRYMVAVTSDQQTYATDYVVAGSAQFDIDITGGELTGRVLRADTGAPVPNVDVILFRVDQERTSSASLSTNQQGAFGKRSLREGRYRLVTSIAGFGQEVRDVDVPRGGVAEVTIELDPAEGVSVTIVDARDNHALDAYVVVRDGDRRIVANRHSDLAEDGSVNIPLADGAYLLSTSAAGYGTVTQPVSAPSRGLRIGLTPGGTLVIQSARDLRGRVRMVLPSGEEYVRCWCNGISDIELRGKRTTVENVTPGSYTLELLDVPGGAASQPVTITEGQTTTVTVE